MKKEQLREILETMANHARLCNIYKREGKYKENFRECPFMSELKGIEQALKIMGIEFDYTFNDEVTQITAISARGITVLV